MHNISARHRIVHMAVVAACALGPAAHGATHYNAVKQFSIKANPNGIWTYMDSAPFAYAHRQYKGVRGLNNWSNDSDGFLDRASVIANKTSGAVTLNQGTLTITTDFLALNSEDHTPGAGIQFQAPVAGTYTVKCSLLGLNTDEARDANVVVILNGTGLTRIDVRSHRHKHYKNTFTMAAGDTLLFLDQRDPRRKPDYIGIALKIDGP